MKTVLRELLAMIVIVAATALIIVLVFFDYIKEDVNQPQAAIYETSREEKNILDEKKKYEEDKQTLTLNSGYKIEEADLSSLKASGEFKQGQSSPFAETPVTDILYDREGNVYYQTIDPTLNITNNTITNNKTTNGNTNQNTTNTTNAVDRSAVPNAQSQQSGRSADITSPSAESGSMQVTQKGTGK